jgi:hypothetical protein
MEENQSYRLRVMQKRLEDIFKLLNVWQEYVNIIYAPEAEINFLKTLKDNAIYNPQAGTEADELSFASKMENENIE